MTDPHEGVTLSGMIRTGVARGSIEPVYEPVLVAAADAVAGRSGLYVYGSVATGAAVVPTSDVDLLSVGLSAPDAEQISSDLSTRFSDLCREVSVGPASCEDLDAASDEGYGLRVFLRHYCVHLAGDDPAEGLPEFRADARAARGFNGDIARHVRGWRSALKGDVEVSRLGTRIARKTLLAVAGLVSLRDATWSTDRRACAVRWNELEPGIPVGALLSWLDEPPEDRAAIEPVLEGPVEGIVRAFESEIGLWRDE
ncbi:MAG: hypothetical protein EA388_13650 [Nitriliruptor sp.]|nr:MAG: hypothetical protein EA388_13650 [Nitriliruptor sp.]